MIRIRKTVRPVTSAVRPVTLIADPQADIGKALDVLRDAVGELDTRLQHEQPRRAPMAFERGEQGWQALSIPGVVFPELRVVIRDAHLLFTDPDHGPEAVQLTDRLLRDGRKAAIEVTVHTVPSLDYTCGSEIIRNAVAAADAGGPADTTASAIAAVPEIAVHLTQIAINAVDPGPEAVTAILPSAVSVDWGEPSSAVGNREVSDERYDKIRLQRMAVRRRLDAGEVLVKMPPLLLVASDGVVIGLLGRGLRVGLVRQDGSQP